MGEVAYTMRLGNQSSARRSGIVGEIDKPTRVVVGVVGRSSSGGM